MKLKHLFMVSAAAVVPNALAADPQVDIRTSAGNIRLELYPSKAPKTVENFLQYVRDGHYNGTIFHRVIPGFMVQGGGMTANMAQKSTRAPIPIESKNGLKNDVGTVAMARTSTRTRRPRSSSSTSARTTSSTTWAGRPRLHRVRQGR